CQYRFLVAKILRPRISPLFPYTTLFRSREAKEGVVIAKVSEDQKRGIVIRLSCETDFVAKNEDFIAFADGIATVALENMPASKEDRKSTRLNSSHVKISYAVFCFKTNNR